VATRKRSREPVRLALVGFNSDHVTGREKSTSPRRTLPSQWLALLWSGLLVLACAGTPSSEDPAADLEAARGRMVREQLEARDITDRRVLAAMSRVPRHEFVPQPARQEAYSDRPLPIGRGQTISQPYVVALMTQLLEPTATDRVLEIGTGSGYQAAVLSELAHEVYTIEIDPRLTEEARRRLADLGYRNVRVRMGDGFYGWPEAAPFDGVIITAAAPRVPERLVDQLREGGRLVMPLGTGPTQQLTLGIKKKGGLALQSVNTVLFVPMTGAVREPVQSPPPGAPSPVPSAGASSAGASSDPPPSAR
jgi:protein-L-isoaspartate(D-aspartate) O-methyltransferase